MIITTIRYNLNVYKSSNEPFKKSVKKPTKFLRMFKISTDKIELRHIGNNKNQENLPTEFIKLKNTSEVSLWGLGICVLTVV